MKAILITGGAGFIGSNLANALHAKDYRVTVLDNLSEQVHGAEPESSPLFASIKGKVRFIRGSVTDRSALTEALAGQHVVVHLAAETGTGQSMYQVDRYTRSNIGATSLTLDILGTGSHSVQRMIVASSRAIYGEGKYLRANGQATYPPHRLVADLEQKRFEVLDPDTGAPLILCATDEEAKIHPSSVYGITKQVQEQLVMTVCPLLGISPVALRYQNVFGPGQSLSNPYTGILSIFSNLIMQGKAINVFEDGLESRDFVYIDDVVAATVLAIEHDAAPGQVFNVGSGIPTTVLEVTEKLLAAFGSSVPITISGNFRLGDIRHNYADLARIRARLGFVPKTPFEEGIAAFVAWAASLGPTASAYETSLTEMAGRGLLKTPSTRLEAIRER